MNAEMFAGWVEDEDRRFAGKGNKVVAEETQAAAVSFRSKMRFTGTKGRVWRRKLPRPAKSVEDMPESWLQVAVSLFFLLSTYRQM
jgi:hypothetical protein